MFKLVILTEESLAEATLVHAASMIPNTTFTLQAHCVLQGTCAGVRLQTLAPVTYPRLTEIADGTLRKILNLLFMQIEDPDMECDLIWQKDAIV